MIPIKTLTAAVALTFVVGAAQAGPCDAEITAMYTLFTDAAIEKKEQCFAKSGIANDASSAEYERKAAEVAKTGMRQSDVDEVALVQAGGVFEIPVRINRAITLNFILDSGASDVQIPFDVFSTLVRASTIKEHDLTGEATYVLADGSKKKAPKFLIRELKIGNQILRNVSGSVDPANGSLLLGQSFLSNFDSWTFDNRRHVLRLVGKTPEPTGGNESSSSDNHQPGPSASLSAPPLSRTKELSTQSAVVCGRALEYTAMRGAADIGLLGVWTGNWNNARRLCSALIVQGINPQGVADVIYVYGGGDLP
jgi:predicted aspartyl protease